MFQSHDIASMNSDQLRNAGLIPAAVVKLSEELAGRADAIVQMETQLASEKNGAKTDALFCPTRELEGALARERLRLAADERLLTELTAE